MRINIRIYSIEISSLWFQFFFRYFSNDTIEEERKRCKDLRFNRVWAIRILFKIYSPLDYSIYPPVFDISTFIFTSYGNKYTRSIKRIAYSSFYWREQYITRSWKFRSGQWQSLIYYFAILRPRCFKIHVNLSAQLAVSTLVSRFFFLFFYSEQLKFEIDCEFKPFFPFNKIPSPEIFQSNSAGQSYPTVSIVVRTCSINVVETRFSIRW